MLSVKQGDTNNYFWFFGMTGPAIEPWSVGPLVNTLLIRPYFYQTELFTI